VGPSRDVIGRGRGEGAFPPDLENSDFWVFAHKMFFYILPPPRKSVKILPHPGKN